MSEAHAPLFSPLISAKKASYCSFRPKSMLHGQLMQASLTSSSVHHSSPAHFDLKCWFQPLSVRFCES